MLRLPIILLILLIPGLATGLDISGYYENTLIPEYSDRADEHLMDASKLRLDFAAGGADNELEFKGNVNFIAYHSDIFYDVTPYLPESVGDSLRVWDIPAIVPMSGNRMFLDNGYFTWRIGGFRIRAGRQQLSWGPAYSFNPVDLFHRKEIIDPTYEKEGVTALRLDYRWGIGGQLTAVAAPGEKLDDTGLALRAGTHISAIGYDAALTIHQVSDTTSLELERIPIITDTTTWDSISILSCKQRHQALGLDFSGGLLGLGVWFEGNYNIMAKENDFIRAVAGFDYTLENGLYMMFEGLYDDRADKVKTPYPALDWLESLWFGEPVTRCRILAGLRKDITGLITGSLYWFGGTDGSMALSPRIDASIAQNADLILFGVMTFGKKEGQFPPGNYGLTARVTVYF